jgi:hypothetical protein
LAFTDIVQHVPCEGPILHGQHLRSNCLFRTNQPSTNLASKHLTLEKFPLTFHVSLVENTKGFYAYFWVLSSINHWPIFCGNQHYVLKCPPWADKNFCVVMGHPIILQKSKGCFTLCR